MNCLRCNTQNNEGAKFCKSCGFDLTYVPNQINSNAKDNTNIFIAYIGFGVFEVLYYLFLNKVIRKIVLKEGAGDWETVNKIYKISNWIITPLDILFLVLLVIMIKNSTAKVWLCIFAFLRVVAFLIWQLNDK